MYQKIQKEISQDYYRQNYHNDGQRFVAWYLRNIHRRDEIQTRSEVTDGQDDKQIDAIFVDDENNTVFVIQGKFLGDPTVNAEPLREVLSSWIQLKNLVALQSVSNDRLAKKLAELSIALDDEYDVVFELITTGSLTHQATNDLSVFQQELAENDELSGSLVVVDTEEMEKRYELALDKDNPAINHTVRIEKERLMRMDVAGTKVAIATVPLKECLEMPGITEGTLFKKNVRQSLGLSNRVNKGIKNSIYHNSEDFFFFHNGITALCNSMTYDEQTESLSLRGLSVVNGCQSLNTILSCSERVKKTDDAYVMFRFYEIPQRDRADKISISTNSQSAVKPRDLRSNDKRVLSLKRVFEQQYPTGYFTTKRGEEPPASKDKRYVIDMLNLGKYLVTWHSQRPNIAYSETKIFDKYFDQLFRKSYAPEKVQALNEWMGAVWVRWERSNPLALNESLLAMRAYAPYHHLYAISVCFGVVNSMPAESVPNPAVALTRAKDGRITEAVVDLAGRSLNFALESAANEPQANNRVFSPQNWIKTKSCLAGIRAAVSQSLNMLPMMNQELASKIRAGMVMEPSEFEARWSAD